MVPALPLRIVTRQPAPLTTRPDDLQEGLDHLAHLQPSWASTGFCRWYVSFDTIPRTVRHSGGVGLVLHPPRVPLLMT